MRLAYLSQSTKFKQPPIEQLSELATALQDMVRDEHEVVFAAAGLTLGIENLLEHPGTTFMRRAQRLELGSLSDDAVSAALQETASGAGKSFDDDALAKAVGLVQGYPYLLQLVGALAWTRCCIEQSDTIKLSHVEPLRNDIVVMMGNQVHKIALKGLPDGQLNFLQAMAGLALEHGKEIPTSAIASELGKQPKGISVHRRQLIERDLIKPGRYGTVSFVLPYLGEYLRSVS